VLKAFYQTTAPILSTCLYLLMGWLLVIAVKPLFVANMPAAGLFLLIAGGLSYTAGGAFSATDSRLTYGHLIRHLFSSPALPAIIAYSFGMRPDDP
jgi:hemolysin III